MKYFTRQFGSILGAVDLYSQPISLLFKRSELYSTKLGQFLSFVCFSFTLLAFISMTLDMLSQTSPNVVGKIQASPNPEVFYLNPDNFYIAIGLADNNGLPVFNSPQKKFFDFNLMFCHQETTPNITTGQFQTSLSCSVIDMIPCGLANIPKNLTEGISRERLSLGVCANDTTWNSKKHQTYLNGLASAQSFGYISISITMCNSTKDQNCVNSSEIATRLNYGYLTLSFTDNLLDQTKSGNPYDTVSKTVIARFQQNFCTSLTYSVRHSYLFSETNFFYFSPQVQTYHTLSLVSNVESTLAIQSPLVHINFFMDDKNEIYYRSYQTFFDILGNVGGIQAFLMFALSFIARPLTKKAQSVDLLNSIFSFQDEPIKDSSFYSPQYSSRRSIILTPSIKSNNNLNKYAQLRKFINQKDKKLELKCFEYFWGRKSKLLNIGINKIEKQLDVSIIITKLFELEKLKQFLLDENQLKLFEYIPKPTISRQRQDLILSTASVSPMRRQKSQVEYFSDDMMFDQKVESALESYKLLRQSTKVDDQKLVDMMDHDIKELFNDILMEVNRFDYNNANTFSAKEMDDLDKPDENMHHL